MIANTISLITEREAYRQAFGPDPQPELDGAGREIYAALMKGSREERWERAAWVRPTDKNVS